MKKEVKKQEHINLDELNNRIEIIENKIDSIYWTELNSRMTVLKNNINRKLEIYE